MHAAQIVALAAVAVAAVAAFPTGHLEEHHHAPAPYSYKYSVHDPHHGDVKSHHESRHGDQVKGSYTVVEPDGHVRKVEYTADKHNGFQAIVTREGKVSLHGYGDHDTQDLGGHHSAAPAPAPAHGHHFAGHGAGFGAGFGAGHGAGVGAGAGAGHGHLAGLTGVHFSGHGDAAGHGAGYGAGYGEGFGAGHGHHF